MLLRIKSTKMYKHLRAQNILPLPSFTTLQRQTKNLRASYGFQDAIFEAMKTRAKFMQGYENRGILK
jgi:hypothetical protein